MRAVLVVLLAVACTPVALDVIVDTASGAALTADELATRLAGVAIHRSATAVS